MSIPIIGLTTRHEATKQGLPAVVLLRVYVKAMVEAGSAPVLIPSELPEEHWRGLYARLDGILFTGGGDIARDRFGGEDHPRLGEVDAERDALEIAILQAAIQDDKPFLGICRGCQVVNVALDGTLYTDIADQRPDALKHDYYPDWPRNYIAHPVKVNDDSRLAALLGETALNVNSLHHQGICHLAPALEAVAFAPDGLVEAVELPGHHFGFAVQWHPEWLTDQAAMRRLFRAFVEACGSKT